MTNRIPQYDTNNDGRIEELNLETVEDTVWSHLESVNNAGVPFDQSQITTVTNVSAGADADSVISNVSGGEMLVFPSGTFSWNNTVNIGTTSNWGIICQDDTYFEVPAGFGDTATSYEFVLDTSNGGKPDNILLENLTFRVENDGRACPGIRLNVTDKAYVNGLEYDLKGTTTTNNQANGLEPWVHQNPAGEIRVDDYVQHNYGDIGNYGGGNTRVGSYIGPSSIGTITFNRPVLSGFPNNGLYVGRANPDGRVIINDGLLMNNNVSHVRVGSAVEVYNTTMYANEAAYVGGEGSNSGSSHNMRGVWFDNRQDADPNGGLVQNCSFIYQDVERSTGCAVSSQNQYATIRDCQFLVNANSGTFTGAVNAENTDIRFNVFGCRFDGNANRDAGAGSGTFDSTNNFYTGSINPGTLNAYESAEQASFDWSLTHPDVTDRPANAGTTVSPSSLSFRKGLRTSDDGSGNVTVDAVENPYRDRLGHGVFTASGGSSPAVSQNVPIGARDNEPFIIIVRARDPTWNADYSFSYDWAHYWDNSEQQMDATITVNWENDPGGGNDLELHWEARRI